MAWRRPKNILAWRGQKREYISLEKRRALKREEKEASAVAEMLPLSEKRGKREEERRKKRRRRRKKIRGEERLNLTSYF